MPKQVLALKLISHSNVVYWWPAWVIGYLLALVSYLGGDSNYVHPSNNPGLMFIATMVVLVVFTNAKLRGIYSVLTVLAFAFVVVLFAWLGWWDDIFAFIPTLSAKANMGFYLVFATAMLIVWLAGFFVFDRLSYWRMQPGQLIETRLIGAGTHAHDTNGLLFEKREQDWFRHVLLGLGAGDLRLTAPNKEVIDIPNVLFADRKVAEIEKMIAVKPEEHSAHDELVMPSTVRSSETTTDRQ